MFSEAVFVANADDTTVNVDDENFWEVLGVGTEADEETVYTSPFMRRRTRASSRNQSTSVGLYDSDGYEFDGNQFDEDQGTTLLGALSYIIYGKWPQMFEDLTNDEKVSLLLINEDDETEQIDKQNIEE
eukprot:TRINITY_DN7923_c0_g1_i1.p1 TRINITY_DN7923_c0_g1~~TRINITY_DN7923_c0_g1_i1.p1  ORF type:complete len:129 (+),score=45.68 TRINITY_DN7923_c0_g1_i1:327-713(+)